MPPPQGSPRQVVLDALAPVTQPPLAMPLVQGRWPANIARPTLAVTVGQITPQGVNTVRDWTVTVTVMTPIIGETADDDLEVAVMDVLAALDIAQPLTFTEGRRAAVAGDAYNAYQLDVTVYTQRSTP